MFHSETCNHIWSNVEHKMPRKFRRVMWVPARFTSGDRDAWFGVLSGKSRREVKTYQLLANRSAVGRGGRRACRPDLAPSYPVKKAFFMDGRSNRSYSRTMGYGRSPLVGPDPITGLSRTISVRNSGDLVIGTRKTRPSSSVMITEKCGTHKEDPGR